MANVCYDVRGVDGGDGLAPSCGHNFVVDEKSSGLLVAPTVGSDDIDEKIHFVFK